MKEFLQKLSLPQIRWALIILAFCTSLAVTAKQRPAIPANDGVQYLNYAQSLHLRSEYAGTAAGPLADPAPGREILYPLLIATVAKISPGLDHALQTCLPPQEKCAGGYRLLAYVNGLLLALSIALTLLAVETIGGRRVAVLVCGLYLIFNFHLMKNLKETVSDFLAMACMAALCWRLAAAVRWGGWWRWGLAGLCFAALNFTKAIFFPLSLAVAGILLLVGLWRWRQHGPRLLLGAVMFAAMIGALNGGWMARNKAIYGVTMDTDRGGIALSTREIFNHMTGQEHLAAWVWWTAGFGDGLAKSLFPEPVWKRFEWYEENGFYIVGQYTRVDERVAHMLAEHPDWSQAQALKHLTPVIVQEIITHLPDYLLTMPVMIYRGLWIDEFIVLGFPALIIISWRVYRWRRWDVAMLLLPGWWSLLVYPALSLNTQRYQMTAMLALSVAAALLVSGRRWWQEKL